METESDGNCLFHAIRYHLVDRSVISEATNHDQIRKQIVDHMKNHPSEFGVLAPQGLEEYFTNMSRDTTWGTDSELEAASDLYHIRFRLWVESSRREIYMLRCFADFFRSRTE